jgi:hypothetical protein
MGLNTVVFILNDLWGEYIANPEKLVNEIRDGMNKHRNNQQDLDGVRGVWCFHSSSRALILAGGNMAVMLARVGEHPKKSAHDTEIELLKEAADRYGYKLIRKSKKSGRVFPPGAGSIVDGERKYQEVMKDEREKKCRDQ